MCFRVSAGDPERGIKRYVSWILFPVASLFDAPINKASEATAPANLGHREMGSIFADNGSACSDPHSDNATRGFICAIKSFVGSVGAHAHACLQV